MRSKDPRTCVDVECRTYGSHDAGSTRREQFDNEPASDRAVSSHHCRRKYSCQGCRMLPLHQVQPDLAQRNKTMSKLYPHLHQHIDIICGMEFRRKDHRAAGHPVVSMYRMVDKSLGYPGKDMVADRILLGNMISPSGWARALAIPTADVRNVA